MAPHKGLLNERGAMLQTSAIGQGLESGSTAARNEIAGLRAAVSLFGLRGWLLAGMAAAGTLLLIGTVAAIFDNPLFTRMTPVRTQDYAIWAATASLVGLVAGTFVARRAGGHEGKLLTGGFFADLAVGCPICNKVVVALLGTSGALTFFAPAQLFIGLGSLGLLTWTLLLRSRAITRSCPVPLSGRPS